MKYVWKRVIAGIPAQVAGEEIEAIVSEKGGHITPADVVCRAMPKDSPLHGAFEWDNDRAAEQYRIEQAQYLLRQIVIVHSQDDDEPIMVRAFVSVEDENCKPVFTSVGRAKQNPQEWEYVLEQAYSELQAWRSKYKTLQQFSKIFEVVDSLKIA